MCMNFSVYKYLCWSKDGGRSREGLMGGRLGRSLVLSSLEKGSHYLCGPEILSLACSSCLKDWPETVVVATKLWQVSQSPEHSFKIQGLGTSLGSFDSRELN